MKARRFYSVGEVTRLLGVPQITIDRMEARGDFPRSIRLGPKFRKWPKETIDLWLAVQETART